MDGRSEIQTDRVMTLESGKIYSIYQIRNVKTLFRLLLNLQLIQSCSGFSIEL